MSNNYSISTILPAVAATCGEGPFWEPITSTLFSVSIGDGKVHIWHSPADHHESIQLGADGESVSFVLPCESGGFLAGIDKRIVHYDWDAGELKVRTLHSVDPDAPVRFNDAKCDPAGRLVAGTMSLESAPAVVLQPGAGCLYAMDENAELKKLDSGFSISNGMAWHRDKFYFVDSIARQIFAYDWDAEAFAVSNRRVAVDFRRLPNSEQIGVPDGMSIDEEGRLWVACFFGSRVLCIDPEAGQVLREVQLPTANITSCCFGGDNLQDLFVTSAKVGIKGTDPLAGSIFRVTGLGVKGTPSIAYKGHL